MQQLDYNTCCSWQGGLLCLPENLEPSEVKSAQLEWHSGSMHENGFYQGRSKCTEVQHAPHTGDHPQLVFCFLWRTISLHEAFALYVRLAQFTAH